MTREEAKALLPVIQAFLEGKKIQHYNLSSTGTDWHWFDVVSLEFDRDPDSRHWRIKPEPREWWIVRGHGLYDTRSQAEIHAPHEAIIHVREVL